MKAPDLSSHRDDWETMSRLDPFWAVLSTPDYKHGQGDLEAFLKSGREGIERTLVEAARHGLPKAWGRALDFGCGLGRLTVALADHFDEAVGVDIAQGMIDQCMEMHAARKNCRFIVNTTSDLAVFEDASFDMVLSHIVLQHVPSQEAVESYVHEFFRVTRPGGLVVFQIPSALGLLNRLKPKKRVFHLLRKLGVNSDWLYFRLNLHPTEMNCLPEKKVIELIEASGGQVHSVLRNPHGRHILSCAYYASRRP